MAKIRASWWCCGLMRWVQVNRRGRGCFSGCGGLGEAWVRRSGPSVLDQATASRPLYSLMGINSGKLTAANSKTQNVLPSGRFAPSISEPPWCRYEHESVKIVALRQKDSPFGFEPSAFLPVVGLWLDSSLYLPMAIGVVKMVAHLWWKSHSRVSPPVFHHRLADRYTLPLCLLMGIESAKACASRKIFFQAGRGVPVAARSGGVTS